jgi:phosphatidylglycerophosphate synthase
VNQSLLILAPAFVPLSYMAGGLGVYAALCLLGRRPPRSEKRERGNFFDFFIHYFIWLIGPIERGAVALGLTPNSLTIASLFLCAGSGFAIATGWFATGAWLYVAAGGLDVLDGRIARATGQQSQAGAFLDSVTDRWAELLVFAGCAWFLRDSLWLLAVMLAVTGSVMTSYTRARGEGLGIKLDGGLMQRPERISLVAIGILITDYLDAARDTAHLGDDALGLVLLFTGLGATATAISRWVQGYRLLREREEAKARDIALAADRERARRAA